MNQGIPLIRLTRFSQPNRTKGIVESVVLKGGPDAEYTIQHVLPSVVKQIVVQEGSYPVPPKDNKCGLTGVMIMFMLCSMNLNDLRDSVESEITPFLSVLRWNKERWGDALYVIGACLVVQEDNPVRTNTKPPPLSNILR